jgi:hypothetical protein
MDHKITLEVEVCYGLKPPSPPLAPSPDADQERPRRHYVYAHTDSSGQIFYVGKGAGRRAWSTDRHDLWHWYVTRHLEGKYRVCILQDDLSPEEADHLEQLWIAQCSDRLVNWVNFGRDYDAEALERYHALRNANRSLIQSARSLEKTDPEKAVAMYVRAVGAISEYASISYETGLVGQLLREQTQELGLSGELEALDRLTLCLVRLGRASEAATHMDRYFKLYRADLQLRVADRIKKRVSKALERQGNDRRTRRST